MTISMKKKTVSIKTQKILLFIPIVNFSMIPILLINYHRRQNKMADLLKTAFFECVVTFIIAFVYQFISSAISSNTLLLTVFSKFFTLYFVHVVWGFISIMCQNKYFDVDNEKENL